MRVFLGGTVNGSKWRNQFKQELIIDYFDPVVEVWNDAAYERELSERRNCDYLLYVLTPKMTGYYAVAEVTDDSYKRPDRTLFCFLEEDEGERFSDQLLAEFQQLGQLVRQNGARWFKSIAEVLDFLSTSQPAEALKEEQHFDAFISYGKGQSQHFADQLSNRLSELDYKVFHDVNEIPMMVDNEEVIYNNILHSDNFIYLISPNAVRSEYCKKELEFAIKYKKRIIPVLHTELGTDAAKLDDIISQKDFIKYDEGDGGFGRMVNSIQKVMEQGKTYIQAHSSLLFKARKWEASGRKQRDLLYGKERKGAIDWLAARSDYALPLQLHYDYINASKSLSWLMLPLLWLESKTRPLTSLSWFDRVALFIGLGSPAALSIQLIDLFTNPEIDFHSIPIYMWYWFLIIQIAVAFEGIKHKDLSTFLRMVLSMFICIFIIVLILLGRAGGW